MPFQKLKPEIKTILENDNLSVDHRLSQVCEVLKENIPYYDWVGFYFKNGNKEELKLRSFDKSLSAMHT